ncbi:hypothetical protein EVAR_89391_1 [Eumeta japonica]|uniref:Uncharacterized protein n=1 Tax=Eumeta variegata TaxID=151549 RepID=A0A4C1XQX0_EUMVA|nr:hypothetical protein EVAR_89391_1 [Eumeta japonica]
MCVCEATKATRVGPVTLVQCPQYHSATHENITRLRSPVHPMAHKYRKYIFRLAPRRHPATRYTSSALALTVIERVLLDQLRSYS